MAIPKFIHQTLSSKDSLSDPLQNNMEELRSLNPGWTHRLYDNDDRRAFILGSYGGGMLDYYDRISPLYAAARADLFRYLLLYKTGGVYLDMKSTVTQPLDKILDDKDAYWLGHWPNKPGEQFEGWGKYPQLGADGEFQQWHIVASPAHPFLDSVISAVKQNIDRYHPSTHGVGKTAVLQVTGPIAYTLAIEKIMDRHSYRKVNVHTQGFEYSIFCKSGGNYFAHLTPSSYVFRREPLICAATPI